jgi:hypothetical protein
MRNERTQLNIKMDAKTHWLASIRACELGLTLADFVQQTISQSISREAVLADEPRVKEASGPKVLWNESLWSEDEATRLYNVASAHPLWLSRSEQKLWSAFSAEMARRKMKESAKHFKHYFTLVKGDQSK